MKKLYFIVLAIIGIYACFNLSSCSKDDKDEPSTPEASVKMRPIFIGWYDEENKDFYNSYQNITYNEGLQVKSYIDVTRGGESKYEYQYSQNSITVSVTGITGDKYIYNYGLSNGKIITDGEYEFEYDGNRLSRTISIDYIDNITHYYWNNGNITKREDEGSTVCTYIYTDYPMYIWIQAEFRGYAEEVFECADPFLVQQGYYGVVPVNWVKEMSETYLDRYRTDMVRCSYEFNEYGYPIEIRRESRGGDNGDYEDVEVVKIVWEKY